LAAVPVLVSVYELQTEHFVLSDTLFALLATTAAGIQVWPAAMPKARAARPGAN
jgi:hypothetical protein